MSEMVSRIGFPVFIEIIAQIWNSLFLTVFMLEVMKRNIAIKFDNDRLKRIITGFQLLQAVDAVLLIINQFTGVLYRFDAQN